MRTVTDLVPGDPAQIWRLADAYNRMAARCEEAGRAFRATDVGDWYGRAAEAFHDRFARHPKRVVALADAYARVAVALDTYASVLAWAQRQAGEVLAEDKPLAPPPPEPVLTIAEQAEATGVITGAAEPPRQDEPPLRRALAMLDTVGDESAKALTTAAEALTVPVAALPTPLPPPPPVAVPAPPVVFALRDDPQDWVTGIATLRKRLRWDGLNRLSPRLAQHLFEGHHRPSRAADTGYHHREGGVDRGALRVVKIVDGPDEHGVYVGQVRGPRTPAATVKTSTFFPDSWTRAEVLYAVRRVFLDGEHEPGKRRFRGVYRGVRIEGFLRNGAARPRLCDIVTAYPRGVRKQRP